MFTYNKTANRAVMDASILIRFLWNLVLVAGVAVPVDGLESLVDTCLVGLAGGLVFIG